MDILSLEVFSRKKVIRTRLKRHNFGIFQLVVFERREPSGILRAKIYSKSELGLLFSANRFFIYFSVCSELISLCILRICFSISDCFFKIAVTLSKISSIIISVLRLTL